MKYYRQVLLCVILIDLHVGHTMRWACSEDLKKCTTIQRIPGTFTTAQDECIAKGGNLIQVRSKYSNETVAALVNKTSGNFWIGGLREGKCPTFSTNVQGDSQVTLKTGHEKVFCSPKCISVSSSGTWFERPCNESIDGFLCDNVRWDSWPLDMTSKVVILGKKDCSLSPCEKNCDVVRSGYMCSCWKHFRPSRKNPRLCEFYCTTPTCLPMCYHSTACDCPDGFVKDEGNCTDIDECKSNHNCAKTCVNTIGSYTCSCDGGFVLVNGSECVLRISMSPNQINESSQFSPVSTATSGEYVGLTVFAVVALVLLVVLIYYLRKRKNETQSDGIVNYTDA
uniref:Thrombomodulin n=1 Tax=Electrophorus electricus TaxID=8005 RepID=A0A4W4HCT3_ELEEL